MTITATNTFSAGLNPVLRATSDSAADEYEDFTVTIDNSALAGPPTDTVITAKCVGGEVFAPGDPIFATETDLKLGDTLGVTSGNIYNISPVPIRCANGDIVIIYGTGTTHFSRESEIVYKRCVAGNDPLDPADWSAETLIIDNPDYIADNGGPFFLGGGCGVDPSNGRFWLFYMTRDVTTLEVLNYCYTYSDDHCTTWSTPVDIYPDFTHPTFADGPNTGEPYVAPFGKVVRTSIGLVCPMYTGAKQTWLMVSLDGNTWDVADFILVDDYDGTFNLNEPSNIQIDADRMVIVARDDTDAYKATFSKTSNGGAAWTAYVTPTEYYDIGVDTPPTGASSFGVERIGNRVYGFTTAREPVGIYYTYCMDIEAFWTDPASLWNPANSERVVSFSSVSPDAQSYLNAGYGEFLEVEGHEYTALLFYYSPTTNVAETNISVRTAVRV